MDNKRKANGYGPAHDGADERAAKRRRMPLDLDLTKGETHETTTQIGLSFLEQIRRTQDKSGRLVAGYFETLPPREGNEDYYRRTRLPISLETIEAKLHDRYFANLTELESYFKRMVQNAKDYYQRTSSIFDDAERVRKAVSNYMTKTNPAYQTRGYTAFPTPLPPEDPTDEEEVVASHASQDEEADAEGEDDGEEEDAEGEEADGEENEDEEGDDDDEEEDDDEDDDDSSRAVPMIPKRRGPGRPPKNPVLHAQKLAARAAMQGKTDNQYENVPYKGLSFQEAQEKLVEELLRKKDDDYDESYFEPFVNLPPRALRDYYKIITEPISIKKLQKMVRGIHGRNDVAGTSDFKGWNAFEEKASLLWRNAYYYNEEGSEIYDLAKELEAFFNDQLNEARAVVQEPPQPKIKLKVPAPSDAGSSSKRVTLHIGGRGGSADSPALPTAQSMESQQSDFEANGSTASRNATSLQSNQVEKARSMSASVAPASPAAQPDAVGVPPITPHGLIPRPAPVQNGIVQHHQQIQVQPPKLIWDKMWRPPGKRLADGLITGLVVQTHPAYDVDPAHKFEFLATPMENASQWSWNTTMYSPPQRVQILPGISQIVEAQQRQYRFWVIVDKQILMPIQMGETPRTAVFDATLHPGLNTFEFQIVATLPGGEKLPGGEEAELEILTVFINVLRP